MNLPNSVQQEMFIEFIDYSNDDVLIGLSGGINSMAVLIWLSQYPNHLKPKTLHLLYHHFVEHSPDTEDFVMSGVDYAKNNFKNVIYSQSNNSVIKYFDHQKMIPHPTMSPCSIKLKIEPTFQYMVENNIKVNLVGYVRQELKRVKRMAKRTDSNFLNINDQGVSIKFPISNFSDEWCFWIVKKYLGWYPAIYNIIKNGKRVFKHNNCLPCKNMEHKDLINVKEFYPEYHEKSLQLAERLKLYWGRDSANYYSEFGREDYEVKPCENCIF